MRLWVIVLFLVVALASWGFLPRSKNSAIGECNFESTKVASAAGRFRPDLRVFVACMAAKGYRSDTDGFLKLAQDGRPGDWETKVRSVVKESTHSFLGVLHEYATATSTSVLPRRGKAPLDPKRG